MSTDANHDAELAALREQLGEAQLAQIAHRRRAIILFEGPEGAGKKFALKQIAGAFDPCHYIVRCTAHDRRQSAEGHWLAPFWRQLPAAGQSVLYFRGWYRRVLEDRLHARVDGKSLARAYDEINEFEAQQRDYGTLIVKLYFDVSAEIQEQRLATRAASLWNSAIPDPELLVTHPGYAQAFEDLRDNSDTRWSPWTIIDGSDDISAASRALAAILEAYRSAMPADPPKLVDSPARALSSGRG